MPHILKNKQLEIHIDLPKEGYNLPRFDWTGKIVEIIFNGKTLAGTELANHPKDQFCGRGLYNEFGITIPVGYDEIEVGDWFHKIGIGLLKKEEGPYDFLKSYEIRPAAFEVSAATDNMRIRCQSALMHGYAYVLEKEIELLESGFVIKYHLENKGEKPIVTNEYNHNFLAIDQALIGEEYILTFPFQLQPGKLGEAVNPDQMVQMGEQAVSFVGTPQDPFFYSNLSAGKTVAAQWKLEHTHSKIGIAEKCDFRTDSINLWGWGHVISPELFINIDLQPGRSMQWARTYTVYEIG